MEEHDKKTYRKALIFAFTLFSIIFLYANEFHYFSNTISVKRMVLISVLIGLVIGAYMIYRFVPQFKDPFEKAIIVLVVLFFTAGTMPLLASLSNRLFSFRQIHQEEVSFFQEDAYGESRFGILEGENPPVDGFYLFFIKDNKLERVKTNETQYRGLPKGSKIKIPIKKGLWGYEVVMLD
ncbi:MAG: hypothetical protein AAFO94_06540, partial [Bacteroidota bacterium]